MAPRKRDPRFARLSGALFALALTAQLQPGCGGSAEDSTPGQDAGPDSGQDDAPDGGDAPDAADAADASDAADAHDAPTTCPVRKAVWEFIYANKSCASASDCTVAKTCFTQAEGCGGVLAGLYLSAGHDSQKLAELEASLSKSGEACCFVPGCDYVEPAVCWKQTCFAFHGDQDQAGREKCHGLLDRNTLCATCVCSRIAMTCNQDAACIQLLQCAHDNSCLGNPKCAPDNPGSPCKALVDTLGGPSAKSVAQFAAVNAGVPLDGCDIPCANP
ncbi:MAG: hypothetical protein HYZ29_24875 [Myxococcales bacterium]|nr:hypothetical protein [Myxococcales bacterium]